MHPCATINNIITEWKQQHEHNWTIMRVAEDDIQIDIKFANCFPFRSLRGLKEHLLSANRIVENEFSKSFPFYLLITIKNQTFASSCRPSFNSKQSKKIVFAIPKAAQKTKKEWKIWESLVNRGIWKCPKHFYIFLRCGRTLPPGPSRPSSGEDRSERRKKSFEDIRRLSRTMGVKY